MGTTARMRELLRSPRRALVTTGTVAAVATMAVLPFALRAAASAAPELTSVNSMTTQSREASVSATCGRGYTAVGVSAELSGFGNVRISKMWPQGRTATARGTATAPVTSSWTLKVQAICVKDSAGVVAQTSVSGPGDTVVSASCAPGRQLIGFGWAAGGDGRLNLLEAVRSGGGGYPTGTGSYPTGTSSYPTGTGSYPTGTGSYPTGTGSYPTGTGSYPTGTGSYPTGTGSYPTGTGSYPTGTGSYPTGTGSYPTGTGSYPTGTGSYPTGGGGHGPIDTIVAVTPRAQGLEVTALCSVSDFGATTAGAIGFPNQNGTVEVSRRCDSDAKVSSLGVGIGSGDSRLRVLSVTGKGHTGRLVVTNANRHEAGPASLFAHCSF